MGKPIDYSIYIRLFGGIFMTSPLTWAYFSLDLNSNTALVIATTIHLAGFIVGVVILNSLNGGVYRKN